ncbi:MAG: ADP-ribosylglycohydrolase family protein, partial [Myxococcota bacterium]
KRARYLDGGGNGAAMRIQPHVWSTPLSQSYDRVLRDVFCNAITTHGHPRAWIGAAFHGLSLRAAMKLGAVPGPAQWSAILDQLENLTDIVCAHEELKTFWAPIWKERSERSLDAAIGEVLAECKEHLKLILAIDRGDPEERYIEATRAIGAYAEGTRGAGTLTSLLASLASWLFGERPGQGLRCIVNAFGTDTDTIATMAGAILGVNSRQDPPEMVQDTDYLCVEAERMARIAGGSRAETLPYPDLLHWQPPEVRLDAMGMLGDRMVLAGFGAVTPVSDPITRQETCWQWVELRFGQRILVKRRKDLPELDPALLPARVEKTMAASGLERQQELFVLHPPRAGQASPMRPPNEYYLSDSAHLRHSTELSVDAAYEQAARARFKASVVGELLRALSMQSSGVDRAVAFSALVAKELNKLSRPARG